MLCYYFDSDYALNVFTKEAKRCLTCQACKFMLFLQKKVIRFWALDVMLISFSLERQMKRLLFQRSFRLHRVQQNCKRWQSTMNIRLANESGQSRKNGSEKAEEGKNEKMSRKQCFDLYRKYFPRDFRTIAKMNFYDSIVANQKASIRVGIVYDGEQLIGRRLLDTILADPLGHDNDIWFSRLKSRSREENNRFSFSDVFDYQKADLSMPHIYTIPSPVLSSTFRPGYMKSSEDETYDLELWEINDASTLNSTPSLCDLYIYVTSDSALPLPTDISRLRDRIIFTVVDDASVSPRSTESTAYYPNLYGDKLNLIKLNSELSYDGIISLLQNGVKKSTHYFDSQIQSNTYEFLKALGWYLNKHNLQLYLFELIKGNIAELQVRKSELEEIYISIKQNDVSDYSKLAHTELQDNFDRLKNEVFRKALIWWRIYLKNDNVEYFLKDYLMLNFMNKSIAHYSYYKGRINTLLRKQQFANYEDISPDNPILDYKNNMLHEKVPYEVQPAVYSSLLTPFITFQLPISLLSYLAYQYFDFSMNGSFALALLGWVVGFDSCSKMWNRFSNDWLKRNFEEARLCISTDCIQKGLLSEVDVVFAKEQELSQIKSKVLKDLCTLDMK